MTWGFLDCYLFGAVYIALSFGWKNRKDGWPAWLFGTLASVVWPLFSIGALIALLLALPGVTRKLLSK